MNFPPRVLLALIAVGVLLGLGSWAVRAIAVSGYLSPVQKWLMGLIAAAVVAVAIAWIVFILPAYWD